MPPKDYAKLKGGDIIKIGGCVMDEIDKEKRYRKLVRNEFLYFGKCEGKYDFPIIKKQDIDVSKIKFLSFVNAKNNDSENCDKTIHFFTDWKDLAQFKWEKHHRNVSGLNAKDFKYFDYKDPYAKNEIVKCSICGKAASQDKFGNGECENCGWKFSKDEEDFEEKMGCSYPMLVSSKTAREQYKNGQPFKATFDEFLNGLFFYSEMLFKYKDVMYVVYLKPDRSIVLCSEEIKQEYKTREEFENKASLNNKLLKDLWGEVTFAGFMYCG